MKNLALALAIGLAACDSSKAPVASPATAEIDTAPAAAIPAPAIAIPASAAAPSSSSGANQLTLVSEPSKVCMVNNQFMGREQIPIQVDGKTYFGCCDMCKGRLARDPSARSATDPVTGKLVDKAIAVIGKRPSGDVLYFESHESLARYGAP